MTIAHRHDPIRRLDTTILDYRSVGEDGKLQVSESATVVEHSINKPIADSEFQLDLSGGAYVIDHPKADSISCDRTERSGQFSGAEFNGHNYEELMNTEPDGKPYTPAHQNKRHVGPIDFEGFATAAVADFERVPLSRHAIMCSANDSACGRFRSQ